MSCCSAALAIQCADEVGATAAREAALRAAEACRTLPDGRAELVLSVPGIHCGGCIGAIERGLRGVEGIAAARVNLSLRRVSVTLTDADAAARAIAALKDLGYDAHALDQSADGGGTDDREARHLLTALGVAGFAAANIMLLSVSVWSGAEGATRDLFHLLSGAIALPAAAYAGQSFYRSAFRSLRAGRLNMDVPITLAVTLALAMSLYESLSGGTEAYFDAAVTLLFFLLIGRYLDRRMRDRARSAVIGLSRLSAKGAVVVDGDDLHYLPLDEVRPGMTLRIAAGERVPVDGCVTGGASDLDRSLVTGEATPHPVTAGQMVEAGTLNLTGPIDMRATHGADTSFLSEVMRMMTAAEAGRGQYVRIADRMARIYAPAVHALAAVAFVGWLIATGDWHVALYTAIAVLIVTCPCALGLAVPVVHVIAAARMFEAGILMKDGAALERLAEADRALLDKTGTVTTGTPNAALRGELPAAAVALARALAQRSSHPASRAVAAALTSGDRRAADLRNIREWPGCGVEGIADGRRVRLGRRDWVAEIATEPAEGSVAFAVEGTRAVGFVLSETLRAGAVPAVRALGDAGLQPEIVSGDMAANVAAVAAPLGIATARHGQTPGQKIARIGELQAQGHRVLMVGDGLNDAPALAAAHVSMAPASASDVGRMAADFVFTRDSLMAVPLARDIALKAGRLVRQNFGLALAYNCIAVPLAMAGQVTPLIAALAMSASSIVVVANSMRLAAGPVTRGPRAMRARSVSTARGVPA